MPDRDTINPQQYDAYLKSAAWQEKRSARLKIDGYTCQLCRRTTGLQVHHLNYENIYNEDIYRDLITLCKECHERIEAGKQKETYPQIIRKYELKLRELIAREFCRVHEQDDLSGGGKFDLCKSDIIRPMLEQYTREQGLENLSENVKQVNDYFRDRRYEVMEKHLQKNPSISAWELHVKTGFKYQMVNKYLKKLRGNE